MKQVLVALILLAGLAFAPRSRAAASCSLTSGTGTLVDFSAYTAMSGNVDANGTLTLNCSSPPLNLPVSYSIKIGQGGSGSFNPRHLSFAGYNLNYNLYTDLTRLLIWGDGVAPGTNKVSGLCTGACSVLVYGRLFSAQSVVAGAYSDQVAITLDF